MDLVQCWGADAERLHPAMACLSACNIANDRIQSTTPVEEIATTASAGPFVPLTTVAKWLSGVAAGAMG
jgi:hypothetical protein